MLQSMDLEARALPSVGVVPKSDWNDLFDDSAFDWDFCVAAEHAPPPGFSLFALGIFDGPRVLAAAPAFRTDYRLDMSLPQRVRSIGRRILPLPPKLLSIPVVGLGHPCMDRCRVGFSPALSPAQREQAWRLLVETLEQWGESTGAHLVAIKDLADPDLPWASGALERARFCKVASLPVAVLDLPFETEEEYLASLSSSTRQDIRRKLRRSLSKVRFEVRSSIAGIEDEIARLYESTRVQREAGYEHFDALSPDYFGSLLDGGNGNAQIALGWLDDTLVSFSIFLMERDRAYAHQIGMRYPEARQHNLYFLNWMFMVGLCLQRKVRRLEMGQTSYPPKLRLGCRLRKSWVYFRHRLSPVNAFMGLVAPMVSFDKLEAGAHLADVNRKAAS